MPEGVWGIILGRKRLVVGGILFWVDGVGWVNILGEWRWVGMSGDGWEWVHSLIIPFIYCYYKSYDAILKYKIMFNQFIKPRVIIILSL